MRANLTVCAYILVMAAVTYLIRMTPFVLFRKKIKSRFIQSLLYYLPYAVLSAMVIPSVFSSTGSVLTAAVGLAVHVIPVVLGHDDIQFVRISADESASDNTIVELHISLA